MVPLPSGREVAVEEGGDAAVGVAGGGLVVAGAGDLAQDRQQQRRIGWVVVVDEPVAGAGVDLDVVVDAERGEGAFQPGGGAGAHRGAVLAAVAAHYRAGAGQGLFGVGGAAAVVGAGRRVTVACG